MIKAEQIPDVCAQEAYRVWFKQGATWKDVVAAAINAWPDAKHMTADTLRAFSVPAIFLPLTQESGNE